MSLDKDRLKRWTSPERWQVWLTGAGLAVTIVTSVVQFAR
jgi:hypothetical protein